jgi:hypothetical protein
MLPLTVGVSALGQDSRQTDSGGLFSSSWPTHRGDFRNTGFSIVGQPGGNPWTRATTWTNFWGSPGFASDGSLYVIADGLYA